MSRPMPESRRDLYLVVIERLREERALLDQTIGALERFSGVPPSERFAPAGKETTLGVFAGGKRKAYKLSEETRRRMSAAQRKRHAKEKEA